MPSATLTINSRNYGAWSLRGWLMCRFAGLDFDVEEADANDPSQRDELLLMSPSFLVPCLTIDGLEIWDTLAIGEYLAERFPDVGLLPSDPATRALCRSVSGEMHSGFAALRREHPMDLGLRTSKPPSDTVAADVRRIVALWRTLLDRFGGPFLAGEWSIADAFYTPVATRFRSYGFDLSAHGDDGSAQACADALLSTPEYLQWEREALAEAR